MITIIMIIIMIMITIIPVSVKEQAFSVSLCHATQ